MRKAFAFLLATVLLSGCSFGYRQPIFQGNLLDKQSVEQLKPGLTRAQVIALIGDPPVSDPFHHDRWDYVATQRTGRVGKTEIKTLTVFFANDQLQKWEGEYFAEQDKELAADMRSRFGNLPKDKKKKGGQRH